MGYAAVFTILYLVVITDFVMSSPRRSERQTGKRFFGSYFRRDSRNDAQEIARVKQITSITKSNSEEKGTLTLDDSEVLTKRTNIGESEDYPQNATLDLSNDTKSFLSESELDVDDTRISENTTDSVLPDGVKQQLSNTTDSVLPDGVIQQLSGTTETRPQNKVDMMKLREQQHVENIKRRVLEKLRLDAPPKLNGPRPALPFKYLQQQYMSDGMDRRRRHRTHPNFYARKKQVVVMGSDVTAECINKKGTGCYHFDVEDKVNPKDIYSAEIWIYKLFHHHDPHIQTFIMSELKQDQKGRRRPKNMVNRLETPIKYGWLKINVKKSVIRWLQKPRQNDGISILCRSCIRKNPRTIFSFKNDTRPFLVITTKKGHNVRQRRSTPHECTESSTECCLKPLTINFHEIGWDSMISPASFEANYCYGSCEGQHKAHYNHTQMVQDHRWNQEEWNMMRQLTPCCAPISYSSLSIMYIDNNDLEVAFVPNMIATACGCV